MRELKTENMLRDQIKKLHVEKHTHDAALSIINEYNKYNFDEQKLYNDWLNNTLCSKYDIDSVFLNPDKYYLDWVKFRVLDPYFVSKRALKKVSIKYGENDSNLLINIRWPQEIAWAQRYRLSPIDKDAVIAHLFLLSSSRDPDKEFIRISDSFYEASRDIHYVNSYEHNLSPFDIRFIDKITDFQPLFYRLYSNIAVQKINKFDNSQLNSLAKKAREVENVEKSILNINRCIELMTEAPLYRMMNIISHAINLGIDNEIKLIYLYDIFIDQLKSGLVNLKSSSGLPYGEFIQWISLNLDIDGYPLKERSLKYNSVNIIFSKRILIESVDIFKNILDISTIKSYYSDWSNYCLNNNEKYVPYDLVSSFIFFVLKKIIRKSNPSLILQQGTLQFF